MEGAAVRKSCSKCGQEKPLEDFHRNASTLDGRQSACKPCRLLMNARWRTENPELHRSSNARWDAENTERKRESERAWRAARAEQERAADGERRQRRRARQRGATVGSLDRDALWATCRGNCALCGEAIDRSLRHPDPLSASLDHILPLSKGGTHSQENAQWAHLVCNLRKGSRLAPSIRPGDDAREPPGGVTR